MRLAIVAIVACGTSRGAPPVTWSAPIELARGGGEKGPWQQNDSRFDYVDDPSVALTVDGAAAVVWVDHRSKDVHFQVIDRNGTPRAKPVNVSNTRAVFSWLPRIVIAGDEVYVLWQEIVFSGGTHGGEAFFARSHDGGATFEPPLNLSRSRNGDGKGRLDAKTWDNGSHDLFLAPDGTIHAAWTEYDGPLWLSRSADRGETFSEPMRIGGAADAPARAPSLAGRGSAVYVAWTVGERRDADLQIARSTDGGATFSQPSTIAITAGYSDAPKLAVDMEGTLHVVYSESTGWRERGAVFYTRARAPSELLAFEPPRRISELGAAFPSLALDGDAMFVSWELYGDGEQARGLALTHSLDGGNRFSPPRTIEGSADPDGGWNGSHQGRLTRKLAVRDGAIAVVNSSLEHGDHSSVWLLRGHLPAQARFGR